MAGPEASAVLKAAGPPPTRASWFPSSRFDEHISECATLPCSPTEGWQRVGAGCGEWNLS